MRQGGAVGGCAVQRFVGLALGLSLAGCSAPSGPQTDSIGSPPVEAEEPVDAPQPPVEIPAWWPAEEALPVVKSNCVRCHLTAGRELTAPVVDFTGSVHDVHDLTCSDCHAGNLEDDDLAHEEEFGFVGTRLSGLMAKCVECHKREAAAFEKGKHFWDLSERINLDYPVCLDCHGHHDVGNPPEEFSLTLVCQDCHENFETEMPGESAIVAENDRLWKVLRRVHAKHQGADDRVPGALRRPVASFRAATARLMHPASRLSKEEVDGISVRSQRLRETLEAWLDEGVE